MKKNNRNRKSVRRKRTKAKMKAVPNTLPPITDFNSESEHNLFSMIGVNYLVSDFNEGIWSPLFDVSEIMNIEQQQHKIVTVGYSESENRVDPKYLVPCSWVMIPSKEKKTIYDQFISQFGSDFLNGDMNVGVWEMFNNLKVLIQSLVDTADILTEKINES